MGCFNKTSNGLHTKLSQRTLKSKGERLGWASISEQKKRTLREIVGEGEKVSQHEYSFVDSSVKLLIP